MKQTVRSILLDDLGYERVEAQRRDAPRQDCAEDLTATSEARSNRETGARDPREASIDVGCPLPDRKSDDDGCPITEAAGTSDLTGLRAAQRDPLLKPAADVEAAACEWPTGEALQDKDGTLKATPKLGKDADSRWLAASTRACETERKVVASMDNPAKLATYKSPREQDVEFRERNRRDDVAWRQAVRDEDLEWRQQSRQVDLGFRESSRDVDLALRAREAHQATRRFALMAAATAAPKDAAPDTIFELASRFEEWILRE